MAKQSQKNWTAKQLVQYSESLANAYCSGLSSNAQTTNDRWTPQRLLSMSAANALPYC